MREKLRYTGNNSSLQEPMKSTREGNLLSVGFGWRCTQFTDTYTDTFSDYCSARMPPNRGQPEAPTMSRYIIVIAFSIVASIAVLHGVLMLAAPRRHRRFLAWIGGIGAWSEIFGSVPESDFQLQRRLAGFGMAAIGIYIIWLVWKG